MSCIKTEDVIVLAWLAKGDQFTRLKIAIWNVVKAMIW